MILMLDLLSQLIDSKVIWINNSKHVENPDGSQESPFFSFDEASSQVTHDLKSTNVTVIFVSSDNPYNLQYSLSDDDVSYSLKLTSDIGLNIQNGVNASSLPSIIMSNASFSLLAKELLFSISWLYISFTDLYDMYFVIQARQTLTCTIENVWFNFALSVPATSNPKMMSFKADIVADLQMKNVYFVLNYTQRWAQLL